MQKSFTCEGQSGMEQIMGIMQSLRDDCPNEVKGSKIVKICDYELSKEFDMVCATSEEITLPKSNVISFFLEDGCSFVVRPSGTEPKIKLYLSAVGDTAESAKENLLKLENEGTKLLGF